MMSRTIVFKFTVDNHELAREVESFSMIYRLTDQVKQFSFYDRRERRWIFSVKRAIMNNLDADRIIQTLEGIFGPEARRLEPLISKKIQNARRITIKENEDFLIIEGVLGTVESARLIERFTIAYNYIRKGELFNEKLRLVRWRKIGDKFYLTAEKGILFRLIEYLKPIRDIKIDVQIPGKRIKTSDRLIKLYPFQEECLNSWMEKKCGTIVIPTGGGKTFIAIEAIRRLRTSTLILVVTQELLRQWKERLKLIGVDAGLLGARHYDIRDVTVSTYHSAVKYIDELKNRFGLIIFDEAHHVPADTFKTIGLKLKSIYRMALTATPERRDKNEPLIYFIAGDVVYSIGKETLRKYRLIADFEHRKIYVNLTRDELNRYNRIELSIDDEMKRISLLKSIAFMAEEKYRVLRDLVKRHFNDKIIVFCQRIEQANRSYDEVKKIHPNTFLIIGKTRKYERSKIFEKFKKAENGCLITTTVLDEGIDVPSANVAIIMSGSGSRRQMIQRVGRVLRYVEGKKAIVYELIAKNTIEYYLSRKRDGI